MEVSNYQISAVKIRTDRWDFGSSSNDYINKLIFKMGIKF